MAPNAYAAAELNVRAVLSGRVMQRGENLIVSAELLDAAKMAQLWGARYTRKVADVMELQEELASEISGKLRLQLTGKPAKAPAAKAAVNKDAYQLYLKALYFSNKWTPQDLRRAVDYGRQAVEHDPNLAPAHAVMATCYAMLGFYSYNPAHEAFPKAKAAAQRALAIDEGLAEAHAALAITHCFYDWDWPAWERESQRALQLNPNLAMALQVSAHGLIATGQFDEAITIMKRVAEMDPLSLANNFVLGVWLYFGRRFNEAITQCKKTLELDPAFVRSHEFLAIMYAASGDHDSAREECQIMASLPGGAIISRCLLGYALALAGDRDEARRILDELKPVLKDDLLLMWRTVYLCVALGEIDQAFEMIDYLCSQRFGLLIFAKGYPTIDPLRSDPRYGELLRRLGLPE